MSRTAAEGDRDRLGSQSALVPRYRGYGGSCALPLQIANVAQDDRELCFEVLVASVAAVGDSSEVLTRTGDVELRGELEQRWASIRSCSRVSVMLRTFMAINSSALATGTEPAPSNSIGVARSTISVSMPELANAGPL